MFRGTSKKVSNRIAGSGILNLIRLCMHFQTLLGQLQIMIGFAIYYIIVLREGSSQSFSAILDPFISFL